MFQIYVIENSVNQKQYIGKTSHGMWKRWSDHRSAAKRPNKAWGNTYLYRTMRKYGLDAFRIRTIDTTSTKERANELEKFYIQLFETYQEDRGYNLTMGGDGVVPNEETLNKFRAYTPSAETKELLRQAAKKQWSNLDCRLRHKAAMEKIAADPVYLERHRAANVAKRGKSIKRLKKWSPESRIRMSVSQKRRFSDPEEVRKQSERQKANWQKKRETGSVRRNIDLLPTHCKHGHKFTLENTYHPPKKPNSRNCKACARRRSGAYAQ